ncbi:hypothetical protein F7018_00550 [Tenacibaculum aiptasiae]|uniref:Lipoprotein n=1 Tax=Tenacibaculum aiptasiae TaxID=426481 RepID=A0A7J5ARY9_9FLAO|nr:hypothetical protein [Tenacibaculum aiptasiae]KAB1160398.1 hypothetical protein F7018_00550 [Tenacibaculum aiptasiae]
MKKLTLIIFTIILASCSVDEPNYQFKLLTIKEATVPQFFKFGEIDTIKVTYELPNSCHSFHSLYYQYQGTTRVVAIRSVETFLEDCSQTAIERELKFPVQITQKEDYLFKFWKGKDNKGEDIFEEKLVPVN